MRTTTITCEQLDGSVIVIKMEKGLWKIDVYNKKGKIVYQSKVAQRHQPLEDVIQSAVFSVQTNNGHVATCTKCKFPVSQSRETLLKCGDDQWDHLPGNCPKVGENYFEIN